MSSIGKHASILHRVGSVLRLIAGAEPARFAGDDIRATPTGCSGPAQDADPHLVRGPASGRRKLFQQVRRTALWPAPRIAYDSLPARSGVTRGGSIPHLPKLALEIALVRPRRSEVAISLRTPARHRRVRLESC